MWSTSAFALASFGSLALFVDQALAHGYVSSPASRSYFCKLGTAKDCGEIQYEPQSIEAPKGMPFQVSGDGYLCSGGVSRFSELDKQGYNVWPHDYVTSASALDSISWTLTANHATTDFAYYITKEEWDSGKSSPPVSSDFESTAFLTVPYGGSPPGFSVTHSTSGKVPSRQGYHIIYAVWTIADTGNAFYQCMDVDFGQKSDSAKQANVFKTKVVDDKGSRQNDTNVSPPPRADYDACVYWYGYPKVSRMHKSRKNHARH